MDIPPEDNAVLAKRRAIQALMKDETLTTSERNVRMQAIMKGDFTDPGPQPSGGDDTKEVTGKLKSKQNASPELSGSSSSEDDNDSSSSSSYTEDDGSVQGSTHSDRSDVSSSTGGRGSKNLSRGASKSIGSGSGTGSGTKYSQSSSKVDPRHESSEHSTLSGATHSMEDIELQKVELQKERQKKLLEINRNTELTPAQRAEAMKAVMKTNVQEEKRSNRRVLKKMGSINESITVPIGLEESSLMPDKKSSRRLSAGLDEMTSIIKQLENDDPDLKELVLEKRGLGDEEVIPMFDVFGGNTHVTLMNMRINRIGNEGCSALASAILDNNSLVLIDLSGNNISDEGVGDLCKVIPYNRTLAQLNLADNKLGDSSVSKLAGSLVDNTSLVHINLSGNFIGDDGALSLFKVLATTNQTLQSLLLRLNGITDVGANALASALIENETLVSIDLGHNLIGNKGGTDLLKVLSCNETIKEIKLDGNKNIPEEILNRIEDALTSESSTDEKDSSDESESEYSTESDESESDKSSDVSVSEDEEVKDDPNMTNKIDDSDHKNKAEVQITDMKLTNNEVVIKEENKEEDEEVIDSTPTGGEAMLVDMHDEDNTALAKRKAVQAVMKDRSLSLVERNKKIQDIMAGKVELPKLAFADRKAPEAPVPINREDEIGQKEERKVSKSKTHGSKASKEKVKATEMSDISVNPGHNFQRKASYDYGTPMAIAYDWKEWMIKTHPKAHDNLLDVLLAHKYRLSLRSAPIQSSFRVVAVVFFSRSQGAVRRQERFHVVGSNDEPNTVSGSICAERAALMQLRFVLDLEEVTKVIIVTDDVDPISPGMLCREFMASFRKMSDSTPILLGRAVCRKCGLNLSGKTCGGATGVFDPDKLKHVNDKMFEECGTEAGSKYPSPHDFVGSVTSIRELFPYPSLYSGLSSVDAFQFGQRYSASKPLPKYIPNERSTPALTKNSIKSTRSIDSTVGSYRQEYFDLSMISVSNEDDPNTTTEKAHEKKVSDPPSRQSTDLLKGDDNVMRILQEDGGDNQSVTGINKMTSEIKQHLTSKMLKISPRLKSSQRREKLIRLATEATAMEIPHRRIHPVRYGAAVLFSDNTVAIASQKIALEYGCTLDAIGQLASVIDKKYLQAEESTPTCKPILIVQCDQFGIAHAPFAQGRSFLTERGYGDCKVLIHQQRTEKKISSGDFDSDESRMDLRLIEVMASELAPSPPDIFGTIIPKNHAQDF